MKKIQKLVATLGVFLTVALVMPVQNVLAQNSGDVIADVNPLGGDQDLTSLIQTGLNIAIAAAAIVAVVFLILNGFKYMSSSGDAGKTEEAQKGIANALIGLVICLAAVVIVNFVFKRLGANVEDLEGMVLQMVV